MFSGLMSVWTRSHASCRNWRPRRSWRVMLLTRAGGTPVRRFFSMRERRFAPRGSKTMQTCVSEGEEEWANASRKETRCARPG